MSYQKTIPWDCPEYRAFVRRHPCCICGRVESIHAHHEPPLGMSTMGQKVSDIFCVPMCGLSENNLTPCHGERHSSNWCQPHWVDFDKVRYDLINKWLAENGK